MNRLEMFERQRALQIRLKGKALLHEAVDPALVDAMLAQPVRDTRLHSLDIGREFMADLTIPPDSARLLIEELEGAFNQDRIDHLLGKVQKDVIGAIVVPFGLGKLVSLMDKDGGNVDTINNARHGVYATRKEQDSFDNRGDYDTYAAHQNENYKKTNKAHSYARKNGGIKDAYSGETLGYKDNMDLDHVISGRQTHDDPGRVLAEIATQDLANLDENLTPTDRSINRSKGAKTPEEFASYLEKSAGKRQARIAELSKNEVDLSDKDRQELRKLRKLDGADQNALRERGKKAKLHQDKIINRKYYTSKKFILNVSETSAVQGFFMGWQQAFGFLLMEFFDGVIQESRDAFRDGLVGESLFDDLRIRFKRVVSRVAARWKDALKAFGEGGISGFLSNLITTIINTLVKTGVRVVRMIREGVFSLLQAIKMVLSPPPNMTGREACHEASKLLAAGGIVIAGVALEEVIETFLQSIPVLLPFASILTAVFVGSFTALAMALAAYLIDRMDLLGAIKIKRDAYVIEALDRRIATSLSQCMHLADEIEASGMLVPV